MNAETTFTLSLFNGKTDTQPKEAKRTWTELCARFKRPIVREAKDGALFSPALFRPAYRLQENVAEISLLVLDYDHHASFETDLTPWRELKCCFAAYTTHSHRQVTKSNPDAEERFRVVVPLTAPIPRENFPALWQWAARMSGGKIDAQAQDASRMYYTPAIASSDAVYKFDIVDGETLDWHTLDLDHLPESDASANQFPPASPASEFNSWDELHVETARRILQLPKARTTSKGWTHAPGICHGRAEGTALYVSPDGAYGCHKKCPTTTIRAFLGLPERPNTTEPDQSFKSNNQPDEAPLQIVRMSDVATELVRWLWYPYIAYGKLTILEGDPGLGKSWLTCAVAAAISCGRGLPGTEPFEPSNVLMLSAEDGLADTLRPRLDSVGADVSRVFALAEPITFDTPGLIRLEAAIIEHKPALVIVDPLFAFTGAKTDIHRANECRAISAPLAAIAERQGCALVAVRHLGKSRGGGHALNAGIGSIDFAAAARSVLLVGADPDEPNKRAVVQIKNNLAPHGGAIGYTLDDGQFFWTGASPLTASRILSLATDDVERSALVDAMDFLRNALAEGAREVEEVGKEARSVGITMTTLRRARERLGIRARRVGQPGTKQQFFWSLTVDNAHHRSDDAQKPDDEHHRVNDADKGSYSQQLADDAQAKKFEHHRAPNGHHRDRRPTLSGVPQGGQAVDEDNLPF